MNQQIIQRTTCRVCGSSDLTHLFSLGTQFVSNFVEEDQVDKGIKCPITLQLCNNCTLVQQEYTAPSDFMYTRHYWYRSDTTETMRRALADIVDAAMGRVQLEPGDIVLDIGSNVGTLLRAYPKELGLVTVGVEPALNMKEEGSKGISIFCNDFWSKDAYEERISLISIKDRPKIITAIGMFYDLEEPNSFIADIAKVLHPEGIFIAQLMCLKQTLEMRDIGNLAHEHLEFYSLKSLEHLLEGNGLQIIDIEENYTNGGSYRLFINHIKSKVSNTIYSHSRILSAFREEREMELSSPEVYREWFSSAMLNLISLKNFIDQEYYRGSITAVYGASTKGNVILQAMGVTRSSGTNRGRDTLKFACDKSYEKFGKYTIGSGLRIITEIDMRDTLKPTYLLILPYAFVNEFLERERAFLEQGGKFIVPLPEAHIIEADEIDLASKFMWYPKDRMPKLKVTKL